VTGIHERIASARILPLLPPSYGECRPPYDAP
jgi:hypothetical protein